MKKARLLKLANMLDADAEKQTGIQFNMRTWGQVTDPNDRVSCGTQACAMGLAALSGRFKRAGLSYSTNPSTSEDGTLVVSPMHTDKSGYLTYDLNAAMTLFEIPYAAASYLFFPESYPDRLLRGASAERFVAKRIRRFVEKDGKVPHGYE